MAGRDTTAAIRNARKRRRDRERLVWFNGELEVDVAERLIDCGLLSDSPNITAEDYGRALAELARKYLAGSLPSLFPPRTDYLPRSERQ